MKNIILFILISGTVVISGFSLDNSIVPRHEILSGGPPKDGIPAILEPVIVEPSKAAYLDKNDQVIGVTINGDARAYPIKILNWHEAVNDIVGGEPIAVTF